MPELIERDALKNHLYRAQAEAFKRSVLYVAGAIQSFIDLLDKQPTIEPEVRRGHWIPVDGEPYAKCSYCGEKHYGCTTPFCDMCGAYMRKDVDDHIADGSKKVGGADNG